MNRYKARLAVVRDEHGRFLSYVTSIDRAHEYARAASRDAPSTIIHVLELRKPGLYRLGKPGPERYTEYKTQAVTSYLDGQEHSLLGRGTV